ncbi:glutamate ABC transporter substrate-binding protein [Lapillicoccus jejuensis]|uniref:Amino acid ABC transporter substrate-binding protein (PAAT family) n=1 Tax=Lapillicoccus jejuensis TaxID=402171 RepID=A0A542DWV6_9MICO|nr:glutamate ABC transporter substrate-binding protein [Lapillicoccus jejuensis]TQJ07545.1 amino acid ABC transporter substrate-binding protein (PAAT family) [Lapillicoccus jejuensis]
MTRRPLLAAVGAATAALLLAACGGVQYADTPVPAAPPTTTAPAPTAAATSCSPSAVTSYAPLPSTDPSQLPASVRQKGRLRVGVSADTLLMSARNPFTGQIEGFDIDVARQIAKAMYGSEDALVPVVVTSADRIPKLRSGSVDMVARTLSMTCDRWSQIAFSAEYYQAGLELLVRKGSSATTFAQLAASPDAVDKKVCAPTGTTTYAAVVAQQGITPVGAATHTACLVLFQDGKVGAIAGDDTVLAGLAEQDPYAFVPTTQKPLTSEPYGLGFRSDDVTTARFANAVLDAMKKDGRWQALYDRWLAPRLGAGSPPASVYGRPVP